MCEMMRQEWQDRGRRAGWQKAGARSCSSLPTQKKGGLLDLGLGFSFISSTMTRMQSSQQGTTYCVLHFVTPSSLLSSSVRELLTERMRRGRLVLGGIIGVMMQHTSNFWPLKRSIMQVPRPLEFGQSHQSDSRLNGWRRLLFASGGRTCASEGPLYSSFSTARIIMNPLPTMFGDGGNTLGSLGGSGGDIPM